MSRKFRIAVAGAASLKGKELAEALGDSVFAGSDFILLDDADALGRLEAVGDEITFVRELEPDSFENADFVFFAGSAATTADLVERAEASGATVVDLSGALDGRDGALLQSPWLEQSGPEARLDTKAVVIAHPAAATLGLLAERLTKLSPVEFFAATVLEPASEQGRLAMDELHQQTIKLLSFQPLPKDIFDAQIAFNLITESGENAEIKIEDTESRIARQYQELSAGRLPQPSLLVAQAPVFHAYVMSVHFRLQKPVSPGELKQALAGEHVDVVTEEAPSNLAASGQAEILVRARPAFATGEDDTRDFKLWVAADNLRLSVLHAVAAAESLRALRPHAQVQ